MVPLVVLRGMPPSSYGLLGGIAVMRVRRDAGSPACYAWFDVSSRIVV